MVVNRRTAGQTKRKFKSWQNLRLGQHRGNFLAAGL
jgi:hypothetical protein